MSQVELQELHRPRPVALAPQASSTSEHLAQPPDDDISAQASSQLPPVDGGVAAWRFLFAAYIGEALLWGMVVFLAVAQ